jgi:hypothetical protein
VGGVPVRNIVEDQVTEIQNFDKITDVEFI